MSWRRVLPFVLATLPPLAAGACSSSGANGTNAGPSGPVARFTLAGTPTPSLFDVPFPSDIYRDPTGHVVAMPGLDAIAPVGSDHLSSELPLLDGFSRIALSLFYVDDVGAPLDDNGNVPAATIDPATLPASETACAADASSVFLLDLAATD